MKVRVSFIAFLSLALFAFFLTVSWAKPNENELAIKGSGEGILTQTPISGTSWSVTVHGTGNVTHLGKVTVDISYGEVNLSSNGDNLEPGPPTGTGLITTPNGDKLFGTFRFLGSPTPKPGLLAIAGTFVITGGTGKYEGATGRGLYVGTGYVPTNEITTQIVGTLSLPKKK